MYISTHFLPRHQHSISGHQTPKSEEVKIIYAFNVPSKSTACLLVSTCNINVVSPFSLILTGPRYKLVTFPAILQTLPPPGPLSMWLPLPESHPHLNLSFKVKFMTTSFCLATPSHSRKYDMGLSALSIPSWAGQGASSPSTCVFIWPA